MFDHNQKHFAKPHLWLIAVIGVIVPLRLRANWRREWEAELRHREAMLAEWDRLDWRSKLDLLRRSTSAFWDALWLQPKRLEDEMFQDLRFGLQMMMKNPGFTFVAIVTLAVGIGANTAIFSVVNAVLLRPLPYPQPEQLVLIEERGRNMTSMSVAYPNFLDYREQNQVCARMAAFRWRGLDLTGVSQSEGPERLDGYEVSAGFFETFGVSPAHGRAIRPEDDRDGAQPVVVIGHDLWARRFNSDPNLVGGALTLNGVGYTVIGVMPAGFRFSRRGAVMDAARPQRALDDGSRRPSGVDGAGATQARRSYRAGAGRPGDHRRPP